MVNAVAAEYTNLLFLNLETLMQPRYKDTLWTDKIMQNLLRISIYKNLILSNRIFLHNPKDHPGTSADLSVLSGVQSRKHGLSNFF